MLLTPQFSEHTFYIRYNLFVNIKDLLKKFFGINRDAYLWTGFSEIRKLKNIVDNQSFFWLLLETIYKKN